MRFVSQNLNYNLINALCKATNVTDPRELQNIFKMFSKRCADLAMILEKINHDLRYLRRGSITLELNMAYRHLPFPLGQHPRLFFGDDLLKAIKKLTKTNNEGQ